MAETAAPIQISGSAEPVRVSDSITGTVRVGLVIVVLFFVVFGGWAALSLYTVAVEEKMKWRTLLSMHCAISDRDATTLLA